MIKEIKNVNEILEFVWGVNQDNSKSSYHKINSMEELRKNLEVAIVSNTEKLIACYEEDILKGVCSYYWIKKDNYAQTTIFLIDREFNKVADEIIGYIKRELSGYELFIGFPFDNVNASKYFEENDIKCIEASIDTRLKCEDYISMDIKEEIESIDLNTFDEYSIFHDKHEDGMYWTSSRVKDKMNIFKIYVYRYEGKIVGSILVKKYSEGAEVFALFLNENFKDRGVESDLIQYMLKSLYEEYDDVKEVVYFIDENNKEELNVALSIGFKINDTYRCYKCNL